MIAFHLFWRPVYRYGLFYGMTFLGGYLFLAWIGKKQLLVKFPRLHDLLTIHLDTLVLAIILWIMVGGRLGHVFLYDWAYYRHHLWEIVHVWEWGMSFIWGVIAVITVLRGIGRYYKLTVREFLLLGDLVLCIVPFGIFVWRIANMLNKELYGLPVETTSTRFAWLLKWGLLRDYGVDPTPTMRINTNIIQSIGEWLIPLLLGQIVLWKQLIGERIRPWLVSWLFFIIYGVVRFFAEYLKDLPSGEMYGVLSVSQRLMVLFVVGWIVLCVVSQQKNKEMK